MSHEIYYTSAPEGLKRGTSGFCTVAATDDIPRALWDRLESLSAYRHQFGVGAPGGGPDDGGQGPPTPNRRNPVSHAHWILMVARRSFHVLSRVCDSGVDHTQRSNAFAHHLVLEPDELNAALGGPAWLLQQPGAMIESWNGQVGALAPRRVASGDIPLAARVCHAWARATGDAGWGGHLIDSFVKAPGRPVCIIFSPGQEMLPLIAESLALLPPAARWNITFNTYFTSMPTSATCLWRCCLAGTPAAQIGRRYAANGIIIDLSESARPGAAPDGPFAAMARTGQAPESTRRVPVPAVVSPRAPASPSAKSLPAELPPAPKPVEAGVYDVLPTDAGGHRLSAEGAGVPTVAAPTLPDPARGRFLSGQRAGGGGLAARSMIRVDEDFETPEAEEARIAGQRRRHILLLFVAALGAIGVGTFLVVLAARRYAPPADLVVKPGPAVNAGVPNPVPPVPQTGIQVPPSSSATVARVDPRPVVPDVVPSASRPDILVSPTLPVQSPSYPAVLVLQFALERPVVGTGIGDRLQSLLLKAGELESPSRITALRLQFPRPSARGAPAPADGSYKSESGGILTATSESRAAKPGIALKWKAAADPAAPVEVLFISLDRNRPAIDLQWHVAPLMKKPEILSLTFWILQKSTLDLPGPPRERPQQLIFKPFEPGTLAFEDPETLLNWPVELPRETTVIPPQLMTLPTGWEASWYTDWETRDPTQRTAENASQVVKFRRATSTAAVESWFLLTFRPGLTKVESTFARRLEAAQSDLARVEKELQLVNARIDSALDLVKITGGKIEDSPSGRELLGKKTDVARLVDAYKEAVAGYNALDSFDLALDLPDGIRLASLHWRRSRQNEAGK